jgi:hypothetical protein
VNAYLKTALNDTENRMLRLVEAEMVHAGALVNTLMRDGIPAAINTDRTGRDSGTSFLMITTLNKDGNPLADLIKGDEITVEMCEKFYKYIKERYNAN